MAASFISSPEFIANEVLARLYAKSVLINLVARDWSPVLATKGESVTILTPEASTIEAGGSAFASEDADPDSAVLTLDQWIQTKPKKISDKVDSMSQIQLADIYAEPIAQAIVGDVETALFTAAFTLTPTVGTDNTDPTGFAPLSSNLKEKFETLLVPDGDRNVVMGPTMENEFHQVFGVFNMSGNVGETQQTTGALMNKLGMNFFGSPRCHVAHTSEVVGIAGVAFHKSAIALATRPLKVPAQAVPGTVAIANFQGIGIRVTSWYSPENSASYLKADLLYGVKKLRDAGCLILGK
jgi:hypothetical protein